MYNKTVSHWIKTGKLQKHFLLMGILAFLIIPQLVSGGTTGTAAITGNVIQFPSAQFTANITEGTAPLPVQFTDLSAGTPTSWKWDFGDGTNSTEVNPTHIYIDVGSYLVNLTVTNTIGNWSSAFVTIMATAVPSSPPSGGGGGGGGGGYGSFMSFTKTFTMLYSDEGKAPTTYVINTGNQASLTVPQGTTIHGKDGEPLSTASIEMTAETDVPAVPAGAVYSFAGYAVTCSPDGATFNPATFLKFSLNDKEWNALMAKANGNTGYLTVKFYDTATGGWGSVPTTVDPVAHTVTGSIIHFSTYGLFVDTSAVTTVVIETTPTVAEVPTGAPTVAPVKTTVAPPAPGGQMPWILIIGVMVLIVIVGGAGYYFMTKKKNL
jgi:PKD repeat protein